MLWQSPEDKMAYIRSLPGGILMLLLVGSVYAICGLAIFGGYEAGYFGRLASWLLLVVSVFVDGNTKYWLKTVSRLGFWEQIQIACRNMAVIGGLLLLARKRYWWHYFRHTYKICSVQSLMYCGDTVDGTKVICSSRWSWIFLLRCLQFSNDTGFGILVSLGFPTQKCLSRMHSQILCWQTLLGSGRCLTLVIIYYVGKYIPIACILFMH